MFVEEKCRHRLVCVHLDKVRYSLKFVYTKENRSGGLCL